MKEILQPLSGLYLICMIFSLVAHVMHYFRFDNLDDFKNMSLGQRWWYSLRSFVWPIPLCIEFGKLLVATAGALWQFCLWLGGK